MAVPNISPWSMFEVEDSSADYSDNYALSDDLQVLTVSDSTSSGRFFLGYKNLCHDGDRLEFFVEAEHIDGEMSICVQIGSFSSVSNDVYGSSARCFKTLDSSCGSGFKLYHLSLDVYEKSSNVLNAIWLVGGSKANSGTAKFRNPKMFINGVQVGVPWANGGDSVAVGILRNYRSEILSNTINFTHSQQIDGSYGYIGNPCLFKIGNVRPAKKFIGTDQESSTVSITRFNANDNDPSGICILKTASSNPEEHDETPDGRLGCFDVFYDDGTQHKRAGRIAFYKDTSLGAVFSIRVEDTNGTEDALGIDVWNDGAFSPNTDNGQKLGGANHRWSEVFAGNGTINTSDIRAKDNLEAPSDALMRAWGKVNFKVFQMRDAIEKKGTDKARLHVGVVAQEVAEAFASEGLDASRYGLFCYDEWGDEYEMETVVDIEEHVDAETGEIIPAQTHTERRLVHPAGDRYGIRYEEALALECAYQRWRLEQLEERINQLNNSNN